MTMRLQFAVILVSVAVAALLLTACSSGEGGGSGSVGSSVVAQAPQQPRQPAPALAPDAGPRPSAIAPLTAPTPSAPTAAPVVVPTGPAPVERLIIAMAGPSTEFNSSLGIGGSSGWQLGPMYEWTASVDPETGAFAPMLAEDWSITDTSIKFTFRKGVQFHHGWGELTAYDFEDAIRDALHDDNRGSRQYRPYIDNVEVLNDYEAVLNLKRVNVTLFRNISQFVPGFELMSGKNFNDVGEYPALDKMPIAGTGPYQFLERSEGSFVRFKRVPYEHWRVTPDFEELELRFVTEESTKLAALLTSEIHIAPIATDLHSTAFDRGLASIKGTIPAKRTFISYMCCYLQDSQKPELGYVYPDVPMMDIRVRRALSKAVDRNILNDALFNGGGDHMLVQGYNPYSDGWNAVWEQQYPDRFGYDPEAAKALLAEAGYGPQNPYEMNMILLGSYRGLPEGQDMALALVDMFQDVGVQVDIVSMDAGTQNARSRNLEFDNHLALRQTSADLFTNAYVYAAHILGRSPTGFVLPRLNELTLASRGTTGQAEHTKIFREIGDLMVEHNQNIPLLWVPSVVIINPDVVADWQYPGSMVGSWSHFANVRAAR